jgi:hypothetical protein
LFADSIRASSLNRLHQQAGQKTAPDQCHCVNISLATREPSTEDIERPIRSPRRRSPAALAAHCVDEQKSADTASLIGVLAKIGFSPKKRGRMNLPIVWSKQLT